MQPYIVVALLPVEQTFREDVKKIKRITKADKCLVVSLQNSGIHLVCKSMQRFDKGGVTFNLTCGKGVTELQNLTNLLLSSFAESHQMQQKNFDVSPYILLNENCAYIC